MTDDDPFKPLSAKDTKPNLTISGRTIATPAIARAAKDRALLANIRNRTKKKTKPKGEPDE